MSNGFKTFIVFAAGAALGSLATWKFVKAKYERIANEEIASVKEVFGRRVSASDEEDIDEEYFVKEEEPETTEHVDMKEYAEILSKNAYVNYANRGIPDDAEKKAIEMERPYVITPEDFGEFEEYETVTLTYYADGVLAEDYDVVEDIDATVGKEALNSFGEYEDDRVCVRNDRLRVDYEILADVQRFDFVQKIYPYLDEEE